MRFKEGKDMVQWKYQITIHELPEPKAEKETRTIKCDQNGLCFVHDAFHGGIDWLEDLFREKGKEGWELVQCGYHNRELLCIWKKKKEAKEKG
jgi:hypothetical protein